jgi:hypothetical protein
VPMTGMLHDQRSTHVPRTLAAHVLVDHGSPTTGPGQAHTGTKGCHTHLSWAGLLHDHAHLATISSPAARLSQPAMAPAAVLGAAVPMKDSLISPCAVGAVANTCSLTTHHRARS